MSKSERSVGVPASHPPRRRLSRYFALVALASLLATVIVVAVTAESGTHATPAGARHAAVRNVPPYWTVHAGDTYALIAQKTGLSVDQLEAFNPNADPNTLQPGQRLKLWKHPPPPRASPRVVGPQFWTVRPGQSFGSIAARTGINIVRLEQLNPRLKPSALQPGARVRLRPSTIGDVLAALRGVMPSAP